jgi:ABC-type dipeptide/oligopeptide/nickel transport system permease subunit
MSSLDERKLTQQDFERVYLDEKTLDKPFEGKPRSFLKDAIIRFAKNKTNVVAFFIVALFILLAIFVPVLSPKDFTSPVVKNIQNMPPRVPLLEKIGIADGTAEIRDIPVNYDKKDPETGLYLPLDESFDPKYIKKGSLTNKVLTSNRKDRLTLHGQNAIILDEFAIATVKSKTTIDFAANDKVKISLEEMSDDTILRVYLDDSLVAQMTEEAVLIGEITQMGNGEHEFNVPAAQTAFIYLVYENLDFEEGRKNKANVQMNEITVLSNTNEVLHYFEGFDLSQFTIQSIPEQGGRYERINGEYTVATFKYHVYNKIFANVAGYLPGNSSPAQKGFNQYLEEFPELQEEFAPFMAEIQANIPASGEKVFNIDYTFEADGVPIRKVNTVTVRNNKIANIITYTYSVEFDGAYYNGFDRMPYFWFGTDKDGRDLFAQIWLSLRTSLLLGLIVSVINVVIGVIYGAVEGFYGGKVDFVMERISDYIASFPGLTILTIIYLNYGPGLMLLLIYLTYSGWIGTASTTRIQFYRYRGREYVLASKSLGASDKRLIFKHILPNSIGIIITRSILSIPGMIFVEASLSFLGFGIGRGVTLDFGLFKMPGLSLGVLLQEGQMSMLTPGRFYQLLIPSIVIIVLMISFNMFGNALRDAFNPTLRGQDK